MFGNSAMTAINRSNGLPFLLRTHNGVGLVYVVSIASHSIFGPCKVLNLGTFSALSFLVFCKCAVWDAPHVFLSQV